jgi:hypothetical protein
MIGERGNKIKRLVRRESDMEGKRRITRKVLKALKARKDLDAEQRKRRKRC